MQQLQLHRVAEVTRPHVTADVIFVHGLGGDGRETWSAGPDAFWPLWIFEDLTTTELWMLEYPASMFGSANGALVISDQAKQVLDLLATHSIGTRPIVFVAHSLGGLLVKQLLRTAVELHKPDWELIAANARGVLFLATPHTGASIASIAAKFPFVSKATAQISANDPNLLGLNDWYQQNAVSRGLATHAYCETRPYLGNVIVDKASANPGVAGCVTIEFNGNHAEICKPPSKQSPIYAGARKFISDLIGDAPRPVAALASKILSAKHSGHLDQDDSYVALADEFENYTTAKEPRLDLAEKLRLGGKAHEIPRAIRLKEEFAKSFARNQLQSSSTQRYIKLLAEVDSRFNSHVYPAIVNGASAAETAALIKAWISDPIIEAHKDDALVNHVVLDRMIYYLTGICHIRWSP
ncbi:ABC-three component system protein [Bradyrhizobium liaoningense]|uniref:ABC-three component system protein n=1 Tax=Bradyrhizobium liaoningense TaxID=43992 RepID=UPI001BA47BF4|nr:ABC-three component system protein [Bradyrhizobium liaoningense]MBR0719463.1 alpha/beta fold hydrolase [Bradyrhizobium liaoningense]